MTIDEANKLTAYEREMLDVLRRMAKALEALAKEANE